MKWGWRWVRRRWWEFRVADSTYSRYFIGLMQFVLIMYVLGIERWSFLQAIFTSMTLFMVTFVCLYIPFNILLGHFYHRKRQLSTDIEIQAIENPFLWTLLPGKETVLTYPLALLSLKLLRKFYRKEGVVTSEDEKQFAMFIEKYERLVRGESLK